MKPIYTCEVPVLDEPDVAEQAREMERLKQRLDMLDDRLDNIDSMVTAVAERIMSQLVTVNITCPHCGKDIEIALVGNQKPRR
jgi:tetrahydromethanopterin S-methyltransferase subunit G